MCKYCSDPEDKNRQGKFGIEVGDDLCTKDHTFVMKIEKYDNEVDLNITHYSEDCHSYDYIGINFCPLCGKYLRPNQNKLAVSSYELKFEQGQVIDITDGAFTGKYVIINVDEENGMIELIPKEDAND